MVAAMDEIVVGLIVIAVAQFHHDLVEVLAAKFKRTVLFVAKFEKTTLIVAKFEKSGLVVGSYQFVNRYM